MIWNIFCYEVYLSIETLEKKIKQCQSYLDREIVVLFADNEDRLNQLYREKETGFPRQ